MALLASSLAGPSTHLLDVLDVPHVHGVVIVHGRHLVVVLVVSDGYGVRVLGIVRVRCHVAVQGHGDGLVCQTDTRTHTHMHALHGYYELTVWHVNGGRCIKG